MNRKLSYALLVIAFAACGGDDTIDPPSVFAQKCEAPRAGTSDTQGSLLEEQQFVRSFINDSYLWYKEVPNNEPDPKKYATVLDYFAVEKTPAVTASGKPKDRFHFTYTEEQWDALSQSGVSASYGMQIALIASAPPRKAVVAYTDPKTPAATAGIARGDEIVTVDDVDVINGSNIDALNAGLFPSNAGETHKFEIIKRGQTARTPITMTSANVESVPVQNVMKLPPDANGKVVGYMLFNDHIATAQKELFDAITSLKGVDDLVLDMRYNGGGYLVIASQLAYMIADPALTSGKTFERETFNDKYTTTDPGGNPVTPLGFVPTTVRLTLTDTDVGKPLPNLGLKRVFVLTSSGTCSASEAVMNGLAGVGVDVIQIGTTTCGKPYGFYDTHNCDTVYFAIQFAGVNQMGFGDYTDGFVPNGVFHGCTVADDFTHNLGDPAEARLAAALAYRANGACPSAFEAQIRGLDPLGAVEAVTPKSAWLQNRILTPGLIPR
jgi:hypothetical protein